MLNYTRIPAPRVTIVDPQTGIVSNEWFRFFNNLYTIAYAATGSVTPGIYGSATAVPQITVDDFGAILNIVNVPIAINASQIVSGTIASARISGAYTGITGVGTLTVGTWNATTIGVGFGGTGQSSYIDGQLLIGNSTGNTLTKATLTAGTAIGISNGAGAITITNTLPDQTVVLNNGTGISVTGTYPNFTITNTSPSAGGTVTSVAALTLGTTGTDLSSTVANPTTTPVITLNVPTASATNRGALSAADWTTFNSKAPGVTFTTNYIPYGQGTTTLNQSAGLQFDGTNFTTTGFATATSFRPSAATIPTNGMYLPAANSVGFATNSTNAIYIDSSQKVGIGIASPTAKLTVIGDGISLGDRGTVGLVSIGLTASGNVSVGGNTSGIGINTTSSAVADIIIQSYSGNTIFRTGPSAERMRVHASGGVSIGNTTDPGATNLSVTGTGQFGTTVGVGAATPSASGAGITFPATQSASTNVNTLDDYEEGTFTPTIIGTTSAGTGTYSANSQIGRYTKIGNRVYFTIYLVWTAHTGTGNIRVTGLPFTSIATTNTYNAVAIWNANIALTALNLLTAYVNVNAITIEIQQYPTGGGAAAAVAMDTSGAIMLTGHYEV